MKTQSPHRHISKPRILFVDDDKDVLQGLTLSVRHHFDATTADSGLAGLEAIRNQGPFLAVVADYSMPVMNGVEFLAQASIVAPDTMRLLLTGQTSLESAVQAVNEGSIFRFLSKPCAPDALIRALNDAVDQARLLTADKALIERKLESMLTHLLRAERAASIGTLSAAIGRGLPAVMKSFYMALATVSDDISHRRITTPETADILRNVHSAFATHVQQLSALSQRPTENLELCCEVTANIEDCLGLLQAAGQFTDVQVDVSSPQRKIFVPISAGEFQQAMVNLAINAIDAMKEAGIINATLKVSVVAPEETGPIEVKVTDNGPGIPKAVIPLLFEPYFSTKSKDSGAGLGLYVVRQIVLRAQGEVAVESSEGKGTTFILKLPQIPAPQLQAKNISRPDAT